MDGITQGNDPSTLQNYSLKVFNSSSALQPYFWWLQPSTEAESFHYSRAFWNLCVQGQESYLLRECLLWFQVQQLWHRLTSSPAKAQEGHPYRSVSLPTGNSIPVEGAFRHPLKPRGAPGMQVLRNAFSKYEKDMLLSGQHHINAPPAHG